MLLRRQSLLGSTVLCLTVSQLRIVAYDCSKYYTPTHSCFWDTDNSLMNTHHHTLNIPTPTPPTPPMLFPTNTMFSNNDHIIP